jgi:hypothetical protein
MWGLVRNPNLRFLIHSDASAKATGFLTGIKNHILGKAPRSIFRERFGNWETDPRKGKWNEDSIIVAARTESYAEPSVTTAGIGTALTGFHFDKIIFDDLVSDQNVTTKDQMDKAYESYQKALSLLVPGAEVIMTGTRWHFGDAYGRIVAENADAELFDILIKDAEEVNDKGNLIFADIGLTPEFLKLQKHQQGSYIYSCLYKNNPVDDDTAIFKVSNFSFYGSVKPDDLYVTCCIDPAGEGKDKTGITVVGTDHEMTMHVLAAIQETFTPSQIIEKAIQLHYEYKIKMLGLETIFFRRMLRLELERRRGEEHKLNPDRFSMFGIHEFDSSSRHGKGKFARIMALQPYHEGGKIKFPGARIELLPKGFSELSHQMIQFTPTHMPEPNDVLDSLADHVQLVRAGGVAKPKDPNPRTPAGLELRALREEERVQGLIPRRFRRSIDYKLAFS